MVETVNTAGAGHGLLAAANVVGSVAGGLALVLVGMWLAKVI
jgi:fluoride ion exporter CrcB/FEX